MLLTGHDSLKRKRPDFEKLTSFGFTKSNGAYTFSTSIADAQLQMTVVISKDGSVRTRVIDPASNDEYVLHRAAGARGPFVGRVRTDYEGVLQKISDQCFEPDVFKGGCARKVIQYLRDAYHDELEFLWQRSPDNAIVRRKDTGKWYGAMLVLSRKKLGLASDDMIEVINLRMAPEDIDSLVDSKTFFPGYHMNKRHWTTICLDGTVSTEEIHRRIDASYELATK